MKGIKNYIAIMCACLLMLGNGYIAHAEGNLEVTQEDFTNEEAEILEPELEEAQEDIADVNMQGDNHLTYTDTCVSSDDIKTYAFTVDFSVMQDVKVALVRTGTGNVIAKIKDEDGNQIKTLQCGAMDAKATIVSKVWATLEKPENASDLYTFTVEISTNTSSSFYFSVGSSSDLPQMLSGRDKATPVAKYVGFEQGGYTNYITLRNYFPGEDCADWYTYTACDRNIIELYSSASTGDDNMAFEVWDSENKLIYRTTSSDMTTEIDSSTVTAYHVRYDGSAMELGKQYWIKVYSRNGVSSNKHYNLYVGNPVFRLGRVTSTATSTATISAKKSTTFIFNVNAVSKEAYATEVTLSIGKSMHIGAYTLTAPNGRTYSGNLIGSGIYSGELKIPFDAIHYDGTTNAKVNGTWRLSLRSSGDNYTTKPKLNIVYKYPSGTEGL